MAECNQSRFQFEAHFSRQVVADFDGERTSTEAGALLLREADRKIGLLKRVAACFTDGRDPGRIEHELEPMLAQRIYGLALGTEWATAQVDTIRLRLLKIAAQVRVTARRIWIRYSSAYPWKTIFAAACTALSG